MYAVITVAVIFVNIRSCKPAEADKKLGRQVSREYFLRDSVTMVIIRVRRLHDAFNDILQQQASDVVFISSPSVIHYAAWPVALF